MCITPVSRDKYYPKLLLKLGVLKEKKQYVHKTERLAFL